MANPWGKSLPLLTIANIVNPVDAIQSLQYVEFVSVDDALTVRLSSHSSTSGFAQAAFEPRHRVLGRIKLQTYMKRCQGLVANEAAQSNDFNFIVSGFSYKRRADAIKAFILPFRMDFFQDFGQKELERAKSVAKVGRVI